MLYGRVPYNVSAIVVDHPPDSLTCTVQSFRFSETLRGVISWQSVRALKDAESAEDLCSRMNFLAEADAKEFGAPQYRFRIAGKR